MMVCVGTIAGTVYAHRAQAHYDLGTWSLNGLLVVTAIVLWVLGTVLTVASIAVCEASGGPAGASAARRVGYRVPVLIAIVLHDAALCALLTIPLSMITETVAIPVK